MSDNRDDDNPLADIDLVEVYAAGSQVGAERIVLLLEDEGIEALAREVSLTTLPTSANDRFLVTVPAADKARAVELLRQAIADAILPGEGSFL